VSHSLIDGRPLSAIIVQPKFMIAVVCGLASYSMMNMEMTSAPLAMVMCNHTVGEAALGIQWHVIGMYAPSFITGSLIARFGVRAMMALGLTLILAAATISLSGLALWNFWAGLALLGVGWNFAFISATTLVTECHDPHERNKVQAFNDFLVFGSMALGSFASGALLAHYGWTAVNDMVFPVILVAAALLTWGSLAQRPKVA
jgi:MFS family permease